MENRDDYYQSLKNESYKSMLNAEVQANVARDQAMKYTQQSLQNAGYGNMGMSESAQLGVQNQYQQALQTAAQNYNQNIQGINQNQRAEQIEEGNNLATSITGLLENENDYSRIQNVLKNYNLQDKNGVLDFSNAGYMTDTAKKAIQTMYDTALKQAAEAEESGTLYDLNSAKKAIQDIDGKTGKYNRELKNIFDPESNLNKILAKNNNPFRQGDVLAVKNEKGNVIYLTRTQYGWKETTASNYVNANRKYEYIYKKSISFDGDVYEGSVD